MIYREAGQFKTTYASDQAIFPIPQDRVFVALVIAIALAVPLVASEYWLQAILIPFLVYALAAIGLNLLTGYAGQLSLGTGGFMAVGAYATYKVTTADKSTVRFDVTSKKKDGSPSVDSMTAEFVDTDTVKFSHEGDPMALVLKRVK